MSRLAPRTRLWAVFVLAALAGCGGGPPATSSSQQEEELQEEEPQEEEVQPFRQIDMRTYECDDAFRFATRMKRDTVRLYMPSRAIALPRVWAIRGAKYRLGPALFWVKGQTDAVLKLEDAKRRDCRRTPQRDAWVAARLRGTDFRAVGNEPSWSLDIEDGRRITFLINYDRRRVVAATPAPDTVESASEAVWALGGVAGKMQPPYLRYHVETEEDTLTAALKDELCRDTMSGERFETSVVVRVDTAVYHGCGRSLR